MIFTLYETLPVTPFNSASTRGGWISQEEIAAFLTACDIFLRTNRPNLVWTYGGDPVFVAVQQVAKRLGMSIRFFLHNFNYHTLEPFHAVDRIAVPSRFTRDHYRRALGLDCDVLPYVIDPRRVSCGAGSSAVFPSTPARRWCQVRLHDIDQPAKYELLQRYSI